MPFEFKAWLVQKLAREEAGPAKVPAVAKAAAEPWHAVSIKPGHACCEGAKQLAGMRFLSRKAPRLPLPDCSADVCHCSYLHYPDRRRGKDRRDAALWRQPRADGGIERRHRKQGRRATDAIT